MASTIKLSSPGILAALNLPGVRKAVTAAANSAADSLGRVEAHDGPVDVVVDEYQSDRPVAGITLAHAAGLGLEAKYGFLSEAAASAGLDVRGRK